MFVPKTLKRSAAKRQKRISKKNGSKGNKEGVKSNPTPRKQKNSDTKRTRQNKSQAADPDGLALSKNDILGFCDQVLKKWQQDPMKNGRNIPAMFAVRTSVLFSDEASLRAIWSEIISWVYQLLYENAQAQARKEGQEWAHVFSKLKS